MAPIQTMRHGRSLRSGGLGRPRAAPFFQPPGRQRGGRPALQNGQVAGLVAQPPVTNLARKLRLPMLAEPDDFGSAYPNTPIAALGAFLRERKETMRKFTKALVEGIHVYKTQKEFSKRVIARYMRVNEPE